ncbi:Protein disulfide-isomerase [Melia azedarach]|uniref:Protein disulfide-isomerase n=1 Tax=Melia azedarach TaxID=155640 RepID=A0ACC1YSA4_MELAZ|nr:Protein disulfide-isomerase [Melia azedarach]
MSTRYILLLSLTVLLLFSILSPALSKSQNDAAADDDEDLSFLEEADSDTKTDAGPHHFDDDVDPDDDFLDDFDNENYSDFDDSEYKEPEVDDKDVVVLKEGNFSDFIENHKFVMVEFYAPWCGHCQALAPEYAAAATELKAANEDVVLAKVDATEENDLAQEYDVQGFPTIYFFADGERKAYNGARTKDAIVTWIKKKIGPGIYNITTLDEAERILTSEDKVVLGYLNSLMGSESEVLAAASRLEDDVNFYQTVNPDVAKIFHLDSKVKRPALVMIKKEAEKISYFDGQFDKSAITDYVFANKLPLVTIFTRDNAPSIFESPIKKQLLLFSISNDSERLLPVFEEAAKSFKGKLIFVYIEMDNEDVGKPVSEYFGITGEAPKVLAYTGNDDAKKFILDGELTLDKIKDFGEGFLEDRLKPFFKSDPIPETNDGDVKTVVGNNFDEIVLDESKDVLLEIYAPWCGHCQAFEPTYNKLAKHLRGIDSLVIAKMDGTTNEHPRGKPDGFPTILFFPAGNKSFDPYVVDTDRTVVALYKFLKKHASIPFKIQKPSPAPKSEASDAKQSQESSTSTKDVKDEL